MSKNILTVDDSRPMRMIIRRAFQNYDCQIMEARNGIEGLSMALNAPPNLIILDWTMPVMDGFEMLARMRSMPALNAIEALMLTAKANRIDVLRIARLGVHCYMVKPFKTEALVKNVLKLLPLEIKERSLPENEAHPTFARLVSADC